VTLASDEVAHMLVKVYKKAGGQRIRSVITTHQETDEDKMERKGFWRLEANTAYMIEIEYAGDMYNRAYEESFCAYFDLTVAINSLKSLGKKLSCSANS